MAVVTQWVNFSAVFTDKATYDFAIGLLGTSSIQICPADAYALFGVPYPSIPAITDPIQFRIYDYNHFAKLVPPGGEIKYPTPTGVLMDPTTPTTLLDKSLVGTPGLTFDNDVLFTWTMNIIYQPTAGVGMSPPPERAPIPLRRFIQGFEYKGLAEGTGSTADEYSRDSSRTIEGVGWGLRSQTNTSVDRSISEFRTPTTNWKSWERFYFRVRQADAGLDIDIWRSHGFPSGNSGGRIRLKSNGDIEVYNVNSAAVETLLDTISGGWVLNQYHKCDVILRYNNPSEPGDGQIRVWIDGVLEVNETVAAASGGLGQANSNHSSSRIGTQTGTANSWEIDFDDWIDSEIPMASGVESLTSYDWVSGVHIERLIIDSGTTVGWTGIWQAMNQMINPQHSITALLTSSTANAQIRGTTNLPVDLLDYRSAGGVILMTNAALFISNSSLASGVNDGQLGYSLAGGADVLEATVEDVNNRYNQTLYPGSGTEIFPATIAPIEIIYEKANDAVVATVRALAVEIEFIGVWGFADSPESAPILFNNLIHNSWWPNMQWAFLGPSPMSLVVAEGGTYTGNGTFQTIPISAPASFIYVRPVGSSNPGIIWFGAGLGGHDGGQGGIRADCINRVDFDPVTGISSFSVIGSDASVNQSAVTYQYVVFSDPSMAFNMCGAYRHGPSTGNHVNPLFNPNFLPLAAFFAFDYTNNDAITRTAFKGPAGSSLQGNEIDGTALTNLASLATGSITNGNDAQNGGGNQINYSAWRSADGCGQVMCQIVSYTGDGTGNRVIPLTPVSGRFPLLVYLQPRNNQGFVRDPSDVGASSRALATGAPTTLAIIDVGVDEITVNAIQNALGIEYSVFVIPGDFAGMNNGTFAPGACAAYSPITPPSELPPGIYLLTDGGLILGGAAGTPLTLLEDIGGIYTIVPGKTNDTLYDRQSGQPNIDVKIPDPTWKGGYVGG